MGARSVEVTEMRNACVEERGEDRRSGNLEGGIDFTMAKVEVYLILPT